MTEFIGSRISLVSKRDIRYVGTLHEINSENSTVALENVISFGTEGRRPDDEVPPASDNVYEYIVFRGSDVKDLRIEEGPKEPERPKPPQVPDDPAILGSTRKPTPGTTQGSKPTTNSGAPVQPSQQFPPKNTQQQAQQAQQNHPAQPRQQPPPQFPHPGHPYQFPPQNQRFGPYGFPPGPPGPLGHGFPSMPYGAPPGGWFPPHFSPMGPGQFPTHQMPIGPPGQHPRQQPPPMSTPQAPGTPTGAPSHGGSEIAPTKPESPKPVATVKLPAGAATPSASNTGPTPPTESKPDVAAALAPPAPPEVQAKAAENQSVPTGPKSGRIIPVIPLPSPANKAATAAVTAASAASVPAATNGTLQAIPGNVAQPVPSSTGPEKQPPVQTKTLEEANRDARAAVAAAMAKLPTGQAKARDDGVDHLTKKVNEMRTTDNARGSRQARGVGNGTGYRGNRGGNRGGRDQQRKVDVPKTDYDFESANAKFNKQNLVKEAIASGSPLGSPAAENQTNGDLPIQMLNGDRKNSELSVSTKGGVGYNKSSSFFDDISSEIKDRAEREDTGHRLAGRDFRQEERQKNLETFGQGSVDNNYRYNRGGRGRGRGFRGRGSRGGYNGRNAGNSNRGNRQQVSTDV